MYKVTHLKMINNKWDTSRSIGKSPDNILGATLCCGFWPGLDQDWDRGTKTNANWICCELSPDFLPKF